ncbi:hypothetical protein PHAVU_011G043500 [Phaseolus vulgaris]|uniref:DUF241 domain protein n=1 Tax=Phaseolus vulgaris TaxID=3885 RepID=V7AI87_PHAVU|nr:hypothetical protein PHAVU_011G043500g [Phaseolus vulgaris]ESW03806.1 hypothetical protein PHAVU_011G043500g [Phaseolus vulgaris]
MERSAKKSLHIRCNSLPSSPHPLLSQFQDHLQRLKDSEATRISLSSSSISQNLIGLLDLHDYADKLFQLPTIQQAFAQECSDKCVDVLLEGSLALLDICSTAQDCLLQSKESIHMVHSVIRRKGADTEFTVEGGKYLASRKKMKKAIRKALGNLKGKKSDLIVSSSNNDNEALSILGMLKEAEAVTVRSLESLLLFVSHSKGQSKQNRWSIISKLMQPDRINCDSQEDTNEFVKMDTTLQSVVSHKPLYVENFHSHVENLEICIEDLEVAVEHLSRKLIKARVSLLNIFSH